MRHAIDTLIEARHIIPVEPAGMILEDHALAIDRGVIIAIAPASELLGRFSPREHLQLDDHVLIPGLINLHTHAAMSLFRGMADDLPLLDWLQKHIWPAEQAFVSADFVRDGTRLACAEMLLGGITCFNDMYFFPEQAIEAASEMGMRATIGLTVLDFPNAWARDGEDHLQKGLEVFNRFQNTNNNLVRFALAPHAPYTVSDATLTRILTLADELDLPIHIHVHETRMEVEGSINEYGIRPLQRLERLGLLSPRVIAVHAVDINHDDIQHLTLYDVSVAHCPISNLKLGSGIAPVMNLLNSGVNIGLGTDGCASNNRLDILSEMRFASLLAKGNLQDPSILGAHQALHMATLGGAKALGIEQFTGSLLSGKAADLCAIRLHGNILTTPCFNPASHLLHVSERSHVDHVWVAGKQRVRQGKLVGVDPIPLLNSAKIWQNKICMDRG